MRASGAGNVPEEPILIVTPFYDGVGGVAVAVRQLAKEFTTLGHRVLILTRSTGLAITPDATDADVYRVLLRVPWGSLRSWLAFVVFLPVTLVRLHAFLRQHKVRVVALQFTAPWHFYFGILRWIAHWKLFATFQGDDAHNIVKPGWVYRALNTILLRSADGMTGVSMSLLNKVRRAVPRAPARAVVIPNGAPGATAGSQDTEGDYAITVGLLQRRKGIDVLIRALGLLTRRGVRQRLLIVGAGVEREALGAIAEEEGVADLIVFAGEKSHADTLTLMRQSRYFVLASRAEGLPLVIVEAMMCGRPIVATNIDGIPEIVTHESSGLLVEADDARQLADAMERMSGDAALRARFGAAAREVARGYEWRHVARRYIDFFESAT